MTRAVVAHKAYNRSRVRLRTTIAALLSIPFIVPFLFLIATATREHDDFIANPGGFPHSFTLDHIVMAWTEADLGSALVATFITCIVACIVCSITALAGAYWFRIHQGRWVGTLRMALAGAYAIPIIAWLIPVFVIAAHNGLTGNLVVAGIVNGVSSLPFAFYLVYTYYHQVLTRDILEAATLDGAGVMSSFWRIAVPLSRPALASVLALVFVWAFGDLLIAATLLQADPESYTVTLAATTLSTREGIDLQGQAGAALVATIPTIIVFLAAQRSLAKGFGGFSEK